MSTLDALMKTHTRAAKARFREDGALGPQRWLLENAEGVRTLFVLATDIDKDAVAALMRAAIKNYGAVRFAMAVEIWTASTDDPSDRRPPSEHPNRGEALFVYGEDVGGDQQSVLMEIKRAPDGTPTLGRAAAPEVTDYQGRFANMFAVGPYN